MTFWLTRAGLLILALGLTCASLASLIGRHDNPPSVAAATGSLDAFVVYLAAKPTPMTVAVAPSVLWQVSPDGDATLLSTESDILRETLVHGEYAVAGFHRLVDEESDGPFAFAPGRYDLLNGARRTDLVADDSFLPFYIALVTDAEVGQAFSPDP